MNNNESIEDILREFRDGGHTFALKLGAENVVYHHLSAEQCLDSVLKKYAFRIEAAWKRERVAIEADALNAGALVEAFRRNDEKKFSPAKFDAAVSKPNGWDAVADPVAEVRRMRGAKTE